MLEHWIIFSVASDNDRLCDCGKRVLMCLYLLAYNLPRRVFSVKDD